MNDTALQMRCMCKKNHSTVSLLIYPSKCCSIHLFCIPSVLVCKPFGAETSYFRLCREQGFGLDLSVLLGKNLIKMFLDGGGISKSVMQVVTLLHVI